MNTQQLIQSRRGNYSILMGGAIFAIMGFAALAVDISLITMAELQCQAAADSASHAALVAYRHSGNLDRTIDADAAAQFMVDRNEVAMGTAVLDSVRYGVYDRVADTFCEGCSPNGYVNAVQVDVSRVGGNSVDLLLAPMFGVFTHDVDADSITAQQERAIMLVQDQSCSMNGPPPDSPIDISRYANWLFLDYMLGNPQDGDMLGIAGYAQDGSVEGGGAATTANYTTVDPWAQLRFLDTDAAYLKDRISAICNTDLGCPDDPLTSTTTLADIGPTRADIGACTNPSIAIDQATHQLSTLTAPTYFRGMVVMSDGEFNCGGGDAAAQTSANTAYDIHDIHIWTILFHAGTFDEDQMRNLKRGYGFFQSSPDVDDLPAMYATVADALPTAIVD